MSVLVYAENSNGKFKKSSFEVISYGYSIAQQMGVACVAISIGDVSNDELSKLAQYGAAKVLTVNNDQMKAFVNQAYGSVIAEAAKAEGSKVVVLSSSFSGKGLAPRVAVKLEAGYVDGAVSLPDMSNGFTVRKGAFSGKAFADVTLTSDVKVIALMPNSYKVVENAQSANINAFAPAVNSNDFKTMIKEIVRAADKVSLPEAEIVVSGGRGLKGPENWHLLEDLASVLGAATACSKPVSDIGWRPHSEHVGQTGKPVAANLYVAVGISGAIQHLAGMRNSKKIIAINKDKDAPIFRYADFGIIGDAMEVLPDLIEEIKNRKL